MRRSGLLHCANTDVNFFKVLKRRNQLPFHAALNEQVSTWQDFTIQDAFLLRLQLVLMARESSQTFPEGLGAEYAPGLVWNSSRLMFKDALRATPDKWMGVIVFEGQLESGEAESYREHFCEDISSLVNHMNSSIKRDMHQYPYTRSSATRIFMANASEAARFVFSRASYLGLPEADI